MEYIRPQFPPKNKPNKSEFDYAKWNRANTECVHCWTTDNLTTHHIIGGRGGRSNEPCNLLRLCSSCHDLAEKRSVRGLDGKLLPVLTESNCLWLKKTFNPNEYDPERLQELKGCRLDDPEPPT